MRIPLAPGDIERAAVSIERLAVIVAQLMDMHPEVEITLDTEAGGWRCTKISPEVWFGSPFFDAGAINLPGRARGPWTIDGQYVRLRTLDGEWVWRLTGESAESAGLDGPFVTHRAVWPD